MRLLLEQLRALFKEGLEDEEVINKKFENDIKIKENAKTTLKSKTPLEEVRITELPNRNNLWLVQSEISGIAGLRNENKTVEKTVLYLKEAYLYAFMIELKPRTTDKYLREFKKKCASSLVQLSLFLAVNEDFTRLKGVELKPVGVFCFNDNDFKNNLDIYHQYEKNKNQRDYKICRDFLEFDCSVQFPVVTEIMMNPFMLKSPLRIPCLFFQNPDFARAQTSQSDHFDIPFSKLLAF